MSGKASSRVAPYAIHWFRRDLRVAGNPALERAVSEYGGRVLGLFCIDAAILTRSDFSADRFQFLLETLASLQSELRALGGDLLVLDRGPDQAFEELFARLADARIDRPSVVFFNRDYEPFATERDGRLSSLLERRHGVLIRSERDHLLIEPHELFKDDKNSPFYQVYSPFKKRWLAMLRQTEQKARLEQQRRGFKRLRALSSGRTLEPVFALSWKTLFAAAGFPSDALERWIKRNGALTRVPIPRAGSVAAWQALLAFRPKHDDYEKARDFPAIEGTSRLSIYLKNGSLTVPQVIAALELEQCPEDKFLSELIWREFYYHVLAHFPHVETGTFNRKYARIEWENDDRLFQAWCQGRTGYPIVDAAMRELDQTGWMHNRARMIVASFLTKDLLVSWQWGERYFMSRLLDGDLASNNGGWQWAASTGCDPQPYFRVFNPVLQGKKFDPDGAYVRRFVPELGVKPARKIHEPVDPIVDHDRVRLKVVRLFKRA